MSLFKLVAFLLFPQIAFAASDSSSSFTFNGFSPFTFKTYSNSSAFSFSTYFVFAIVPDFQPLGGHGMAFVIAPTRGLPGSLPSTYLGLFNESNNGIASNHIVAVELDTLKSSEFNDINDNHVGIDITGLESVLAKPTAYYDEKTGSFQNLTLNSGHSMQVWIEYDGPSQLFNVTLAPLNDGKPSIPLLSLRYDLSPIIDYVCRISAAPLLSSIVLGWSFNINGVAQPLDLSQLPSSLELGQRSNPRLDSWFACDFHRFFTVSFSLCSLLC
ncbi:UNVERIFIED_CONTAM: L-type lectin-domain containing receptor kinase V.9 [Sesamum calycinum]|uniref:L-type lectin-domain containing receptor kinase V.9 n=1 Tax=Sesamum calycinum TaxID=2727403 RepID=A0AAW2NX26_9LAMI